MTPELEQAALDTLRAITSAVKRLEALINDLRGREDDYSGTTGKALRNMLARVGRAS